MSRTYIPVALRREVTLRALYRCEYCRIPEKHGGPTDAPNLALACHRCNLYKGDSFAAYSGEWDRAVFLYHPRKQRWSENFVMLPSGVVRPLTMVGEATVRILRINDVNRVAKRAVLIEYQLL